MKTLGIVGGIAPESTVDYYRRIIAQYRARTADGSYPPIALAEARDMARDALRDAQKGSDPGAQKQADRQAETFKDLADAFMERYSKKKKKSWREDQRIIDTYLEPKFRHALAKNVTRAQIQQLLEEIADRAPWGH